MFIDEEKTIWITFVAGGFFMALFFVSTKPFSKIPLISKVRNKMILHISKPEAEDYEKLTDICLKTNRHWGYPDYLIDLWKDELTITPRYIRNHDVLKIENEHGKIMGFGSIEKKNNNDYYEINHLWILPQFMEHNIGKYLLEHFEYKVGPQKTIKVVADQNISHVFQNCGYMKVGETKSKPDGRSLSVLKKIIAAKPDE